VQSGGRDVSDEILDVQSAPVAGIVIRLTQAPSTLAGVVTGAARTQATARDERDDVGRALVVVFPTDPARWRDYGDTPRRLRGTGVDGAGAFTLAGLPPGEYFVAAVSDDFVSDWRAPAVLKALAQSASRVTIGRGAKVSQNLAMIAMPQVNR
jgi:hypothetical protein